MTPIITDATYFIEVLKQHLIQERFMVDDKRFAGVFAEASAIRDIHFRLSSKINVKKYPDVIYCMTYQDGILDGFDRIGARLHTGEYSCESHVAQLVRKYEEIFHEKVKARRYADAAYASGYRNALLFLVLDDASRKHCPRYFVFGGPEEIRTLAAFKEFCCRETPLDKRANKRAQHLAKRLVDGLVFHHRPVL